MANYRWTKALNLAVSANRFRLVPGETERRAQVALMAALAIRPQEARTREWEAQIPADVEAPMRRLDDIFARMRPRDALTRGQQERDILPAILEPGNYFF